MFNGHEFDPQYTLALRLARDIWSYLFQAPTKDEIPALLRKYALTVKQYKTLKCILDVKEAKDLILKSAFAEILSKIIIDHGMEDPGYRHKTPDGKTDYKYISGWLNYFFWGRKNNSSGAWQRFVRDFF